MKRSILVDNTRNHFLRNTLFPKLINNTCLFFLTAFLTTLLLRIGKLVFKVSFGSHFVLVFGFLLWSKGSNISGFKQEAKEFVLHAGGAEFFSSIMWFSELSLS